MVMPDPLRCGLVFIVDSFAGLEWIIGKSSAALATLNCIPFDAVRWALCQGHGIGSTARRAHISCISSNFISSSVGVRTCVLACVRKTLKWSAAVSECNRKSYTWAVRHSPPKYYTSTTLYLCISNRHNVSFAIEVRWRSGTAFACGYRGLLFLLVEL